MSILLRPRNLRQNRRPFGEGILDPDLAPGSAGVLSCEDPRWNWRFGLTPAALELEIANRENALAASRRRGPSAADDAAHAAMTAEDEHEKGRREFWEAVEGYDAEDRADPSVAPLMPPAGEGEIDADAMEELARQDAAEEFTQELAGYEDLRAEWEPGLAEAVAHHCW